MSWSQRSASPCVRGVNPRRTNFHGSRHAPASQVTGVFVFMSFHFESRIFFTFPPVLEFFGSSETGPRGLQTRKKNTKIYRSKIVYPIRRRVRKPLKKKLPKISPWDVHNLGVRLYNIIRRSPASRRNASRARGTWTWRIMYVSGNDIIIHGVSLFLRRTRRARPA